MKDITGILVRLRLGKNPPIAHRELIEDAKEMLEIETGTKPTTRTILGSVWQIPIYPRMRDHIWNLLIGRIRCGSYWKHIPGYEDRQWCKACETHGEREVEESINHLWLGCQHNSQSNAWEYTRWLWNKTSKKPMPYPSIGLIRGSTAITLIDGTNTPAHTDSTRMRLLVTITCWAIWKTRNNLAISNTPIERTDSAKLTREILQELLTRSYNSLRMRKMKSTRKKIDALLRAWEGLISPPPSGEKGLRFRF